MKIFSDFLFDLNFYGFSEKLGFLVIPSVVLCIFKSIKVGIIAYGIALCLVWIFCINAMPKKPKNNSEYEVERYERELRNSKTYNYKKENRSGLWAIFLSIPINAASYVIINLLN